MDQLETAVIKHMAFYPMKAASGIDVDEAILTKSGLVIGNYSDHSFMAVRASPNREGVHEFLTQRHKRERSDKRQSLSIMALIKPIFNGDSLQLTWEYSEQIYVPPYRDDGRVMKVKVFDEVYHAIDQGDVLAEWLSDHLGLKARLVKAAGPFSRMSRQNYMQNDNPVNFHDAYPIHFFDIDSVVELSEIAGQQIPWKSFRPQIVTEGLGRQMEHKIHSGNLAGIHFIDPKPCDRCPVTLIDQVTGEINESGEPLAALHKYKRWLNNRGELKVIFGENMLPQGEGTIRLGDIMDVLTYRNPSLVYGKDVRPLRRF